MMTHTTDLNIFKKIFSFNLPPTPQTYTEALANPRHADSHPALQLGLSLCIEEMKARGIEITEPKKIQ